MNLETEEGHKQCCVEHHPGEHYRKWQQLKLAVHFTAECHSEFTSGLDPVRSATQGDEAVNYIESLQVLLNSFAVGLNSHSYGCSAACLFA